MAHEASVARQRHSRYPCGTITSQESEEGLPSFGKGVEDSMYSLEDSSSKMGSVMAVIITVCVSRQSCSCVTKLDAKTILTS